MTESQIVFITFVKYISGGFLGIFAILALIEWLIKIFGRNYND